MGSFISGPIISFSVDSEALVASAKSAIDQVTRQIQQQTAQNGKNIAQAISDPLQQQAAKLRALYSTGNIGLKDLQVEQKKFVAQLDVEITRLVRKNDLTKQELTTLKQVTLERERQANALQRGIGVGVTSGTQSALSLASGNIGVLLSRGLGQLGARLAGVAGGSGGGEFSAAASGIAALTANGGVAIGVIGGLATVLVGAGIAAASLAKSGGDLAEKFSNVSQRTGISIKDLQVLDAVAKVTQLDLGDIVIGFRKFSQAITGGAGGEAGGFEGAGKKSTEILKILGVTSKDSFTAIEQVATAFEKLPDGPLKAAAAVELFGRSGLQLIPILNQGKDGVEKFRVLIEKYGPAINKDAVQAQNDWEVATLKLSLEVDRLKLSLIPVLGFMTDMANKIADIKNAGKDPRAFQGLLEVLTHIVTLPLGGGTANLRLLAQIFKDDAPKVETAADAWKKLGFGFDDAILKAKATGAQLKALEDQLNGSAEARKKAAEEAKKEAQAVLDERFKSAAASLQSISQGAQVGGLSGADKALEEERLKLEKIAEIILEFPNLAGQAATAAEQVVAATRGELEKLADESLKKINDEQDKAFSEEVKRQEELAKTIKEIDDKLAIDRAEASGNATSKIIAENNKLRTDTLAKAKEEGATTQQLADLSVKIEADKQQQIAKLRTEQVKKTQDEIKAEAGRLFDALISGTKNFTQALKQTLLAVILTPVKLVFEAVVAAIFAPLVQRVKDALVNLGKSLQGKGGILGKIGDILVPKDSETKINTQATGDNTTATGANTDALNALTQALQTGGVGTGAGAGNSLFSALGFTPPGGIGLPSGSGGTGGIQGTAGGPLGALFRGVTAGAATVLLGLGNVLGGKNTGVKVGGGITAAGGTLKGLGSAFNNKTLGVIGDAISGGGLVVSGVSQGGALGIGEATLGGTQAGAAIGGLVGGPVGAGIGAAIGAAAGFVAGVFGSIFGHHGPSQKDIASAIKKQTIANPDQFLGISFERSAQGRFADTLNSGFLESPGGTFSSFALGGRPRSASIVNNFTVNAVDAKSVKQLFEDHGDALGQVVASQTGSVRSGIGQAVRQAVHPA